MTELYQMLERLQREGFYGQIELKFERGQLTLIRKIQTFVPKYQGENRSERDVARRQQ